MNKIKNMSYIITNPKLVKQLLKFSIGGYLKEIGWINSFNKFEPVNNNNEPLPWVTYSFIDFITPRLSQDFLLFEYGSGNSTHYYSKLVKEVYSIEHDESWFNKVRNSAPDNAKIEYVNLVKGGEYCKYINNHNFKFDVVIVDGRDRVNCIKNSINALSEFGVIVLDDSERNEYMEGHNFLIGLGFRCIDFSGISPGLFYNKKTSVYYRENNCLNI